MLQSVNEIIADLRKSIHGAIIGKDEVIDQMLCALLCEGHILIEDVPGVGKTSMVSALASAVGCSFARIQFTPDLMPGDVTGYTLPDLKTGEFIFKPGTLHAQIVLADEINRATAKTQSALLEAMEERQITVEGVTYPLPRPFMVLATQNPIELSGVYPLPEAQMDRFMLRVSIGYPTPAEELKILTLYGDGGKSVAVRRVVTAENILKLQDYTRDIYIANSVRKYIVRIANATRESKELRCGVSPRGTLLLMKAAQGLAVVRGYEYVTPQHVQDIAEVALCHRLQVTPEMKAAGRTPRDVLRKIIAAMPVPQGREE
ncbi:MAG: MoxR family ATPase [Clostridiales bacterium]|nr:MoxR family ATPase [Clostridiales bacterium]